MGDTNQLIYVQKYAEDFEGPYLEIGSKDYGNTQDLRSLFSGKGQYIGIDMLSGAGVDIVVNMTEEFEKIDELLGKKRFGTIFCLSVLEHCDQPFKMAENMTRLLKEDSSVVVSAPFCWKLHGYPSDYWRFSPDGIRKLFPAISFIEDKCCTSTSKKKDFRKLDADLCRISFSFSRHSSKGRPIRGLSAKLLTLLSKLKIYDWIAGYSYVIPATNIIMIGEKHSQTTKVKMADN